MSAEGRDTPITPWAASRLVAAREVRERLRNKSFQVATVVTILLVVAVVVAPRLLDEDTPTYKLAFTEEAPAVVVRTMEAVGDSVGARVEVVPPTSEADAAPLLRSGDLDLLVTPADVVARIAVPPDDGSRRGRFTNTVSAVLALQQGLADAGVPPDQLGQALSQPPLPVRGLEPDRPSRARERAIAGTGVVLLYLFLSLYGSWILLGVIEEKSSRVIEVLLATMRPRQLLVGKVLGIGAVALGQGVLVLLVALGTATATGIDVLRGAAPGLIAQAFAWFLLGYALYAMLYAAAGSLVSRTEDAQNVAFPITIPLVAAQIASIGALTANESPLVVDILSWIPFTAPLAMPARVAVGGAGTPEVLAAMALTLVTTVVLARVAGAVYSGAVLRTGARVRWREALRADRRDRRAAAATTGG
jgi:ABC-2 type transport system permease protein